MAELKNTHSQETCVGWYKKCVVMFLFMALGSIEMEGNAPDGANYKINVSDPPPTTSSDFHLILIPIG